MPLQRQQDKPRQREPHAVTPIHGEFGRYTVPSRSAAKKGEDENYVVDVLAVEETAGGKVTGTCPCKGWSVRKTCTHLDDAKAFHEALVEQVTAARMGFERHD